MGAWNYKEKGIKKMAINVKTSSFGKYRDGQDVSLYTISNDVGMEVAVTNLGAIIVKLIVPDARGNKDDLVLGFDTAEEYLKNPSFFGAVIGPSANRIGNAKYTIDGVEYQADVNDGVNNLHSDMENGYHKCLWNATVLENGVLFELEDTDGNMGFPGNKKVSVSYELSEDNALKLHYHGTSDKKTIINLTNHTYFNLEGHKSGKILDHELWMAASHFTPADSGSIPLGEIASVEKTPMDFTTAKKVGRDIAADFGQIKFGGGFDHNWVIDGWKDNGELIHFATVKAPASGRIMKAYTTLPGVQFYAGNFIAEQAGKDGAVYNARMGLCLETQYYPDSVNKPNFPSCIFGEGREYDSVTVYSFENR